MKERPILFSAPMVRAILAGSKTQMRRMIKPQPEVVEYSECGCTFLWWKGGEICSAYPRCLYGKVGDRLWVKETFCKYVDQSGPDDDDCVAYQSTDKRSHSAVKWTPSIFMPRWASRITLEITGVRLERLQAITEHDAIKEGVAIDKGHAYVVAGHEHFAHRTAVGCMETLWGVINGADSWEANPWVWVVEFRRITP